jgi:Tannase and feruloyl esterase
LIAASIPSGAGHRRRVENRVQRERVSRRCAQPSDSLTFPLSTPVEIANTTFTAAQVVAAGAFTPPGAPPNGPALAAWKALPAFCRVQGVIQPTSDSHIEFEVWLPASGWNGKYLGVGNGGFAGSINYLNAIGRLGAASNADPGLAAALATGYAASSTDTGHKGGFIDAKWALGHQEEIVDFGYRAVHETAERSKAIIRAFYGEAPVIVLDHPTDTEKRAHIIAHHKLAWNAGWDVPVPAGEIAAVEIGPGDVGVIIRRWQQHTGKGATPVGDGRDVRGGRCKATLR